MVATGFGDLSVGVGSMSALVYQAQPVSLDKNMAIDWKALTQTAAGSPFTAWPWVSTWLNTLVDAAWVVRVYQGSLLVAMTVLIQRRHRHRGGFPARSLHLNHSGDDALDQIWPEYNGFVVRSGHEAEVYQTCLSGLKKALPNWDEFCTGVMRDERVVAINQQANFLVHTLWEAPTYSVDLTRLRLQGQNYLDSLSRSTRYQIRQSRRKLEGLGHLTFTTDTESEAVLNGFKRIGPFHEQDWGKQSGYLNPHFTRFHHALILSPEAKGLTRIHTAWLNEKPIASLYNLRFCKRDYFYLGFADRTLDKAIRPGLMLHAWQIQQALDEGHLEYDFMGGDMQYKRQLAECTGQLVSVRLKQPCLKFEVEQTLRQTLQRVLAIREAWRERASA